MEIRKTSPYIIQFITELQVLADIDDEIRENQSSIIERIYAAFESIHRYVTDLNSFLQDLNEGTFIQRTLENVFTNEDGKQLMVRRKKMLEA